MAAELYSDGTVTIYSDGDAFDGTMKHFKRLCENEQLSLLNERVYTPDEGHSDPTPEETVTTPIPEVAQDAGPTDIPSAGPATLDTHVSEVRAVVEKARGIVLAQLPKETVETGGKKGPGGEVLDPGTLHQSVVRLTCLVANNLIGTTDGNVSAADIRIALGLSHGHAPMGEGPKWFRPPSTGTISQLADDLQAGRRRLTVGPPITYPGDGEPLLNTEMLMGAVLHRILSGLPFK
jgi:hypothetical protein